MIITHMTYKTAMAAGQDAGNRNMERGERTSWNEDDYNAAAKIVARLLGLVVRILGEN